MNIKYKIITTILIAMFLASSSIVSVSASAGDLKWFYLADGAINSSPAIAKDGTIYIGSNDTYMYAIYPTGLMKWKFKTGGIVQGSAAIGPDGTIYFGSYDSNVYAVTPEGALIWKYPTGGFVYSTPAIGVINGKCIIYVGSNDGKVYAFNQNGSLYWATPYATGATINMSSPTIGADGTVYIGTASAAFDLHAINPDGSVKWAFPTNGITESSAAIAKDGTIYVGSGDGNVYAINPDGTQKWAKFLGNIIQGSPAIGADGTIYIGCYNNIVFALNPADGGVKWQYTANGTVYSSPAIGADGTIYIGCEGGYLHAIDPLSGTMKWKNLTGSITYSSPAIGADGTIYVGINANKLLAIESTSAWNTIDYINSTSVYADSRWPKFGQNNYNLHRGLYDSCSGGSGEEAIVGDDGFKLRKIFPMPAIIEILKKNYFMNHATRDNTEDYMKRCDLCYTQDLLKEARELITNKNVVDEDNACCSPENIIEELKLEIIKNNLDKDPRYLRALKLLDDGDELCRECNEEFEKGNYGQAQRLTKEKCEAIGEAIRLMIEVLSK